MLVPHLGSCEDAGTHLRGTVETGRRQWTGSPRWSSDRQWPLACLMHPCRARSFNVKLFAIATLDRQPLAGVSDQLHEIAPHLWAVVVAMSRRFAAFPWHLGRLFVLARWLEPKLSLAVVAALLVAAVPRVGPVHQHTNFLSPRSKCTGKNVAANIAVVQVNHWCNW